MGAPLTWGAHGVRRRDGPSALVVALVLDAVAVVAFGVNVVTLSRRGPDDPIAESPLDTPLVTLLFLVAVLAALAAGLVAGRSVARAPLGTRRGRWAVRLAVAGALVVPAVGLSIAGVARALDATLPEGWGQPLVPVALLPGLAALVLGATAQEPGHRGLLVLPLMVSATVLTFLLGEVLVPH